MGVEPGTGTCKRNIEVLFIIFIVACGIILYFLYASASLHHWTNDESRMVRKSETPNGLGLVVAWKQYFTFYVNVVRCPWNVCYLTYIALIYLDS